MIPEIDVEKAIKYTNTIAKHIDLFEMVGDGIGMEGLRLTWYYISHHKVRVCGGKEVVVLVVKPRTKFSKNS